MCAEYAYIVAGIPLGALVLYAFWLYCRSGAEISFGTWCILAYGDIIDSGTYFGITERWWVNIVPACFALGSIATFCYAFHTKRFSKIGWIDIVCIVADVAITALWVYSLKMGTNPLAWAGSWFRHANGSTIANLAYQLTALLAFVPTWLSQGKGDEHEPPVPWFLWALACAGFTAITLYGHDMWEELAYPLINLFTHSMIAWAATSAQKRINLIQPRCA